MDRKVCLVTGGGRGIGAALCTLLAERGYAVVVNSVSASAGALAADLRARGHTAWAVQADVADDAQVRGLFARIESKIGRLDALVNNAGVVDVASRVDDMDAARLERMFRTNVLSAFGCCREAVRRMSTRRGGAGGSIVNVGSVAARLDAPGQYVDYAASKAALDALTVGLAKEVAAEGIRVNAVRPGIIDTDIHASGGQPDRATRLAPDIPMQRAGSAAEVAHAIAWLLSNEASYVTGSIVDVAGGR
jgi:NAD(P)-dependent dehydrogenase (short-subunit alcohol dehydrogenase family)